MPVCASERDYKSQAEGMTLIEIMVAIAILSIVTTLIWSGFSQTARNKQRVEAQLDRYHTVRMALERMSRELASAYVSIHLNPSQSLQTVRTAFVGRDRARGDRVDFTAFTNQRLRADAWESDQHEVSYFVTQDRDGNDVLARREQKRVDDEPGRGGSSQILVEGVEEFQLEYLDSVTGNWQNTWDTVQATGQANRLPAQVKITLKVRDPQDGGREETFGTRATLNMRYALNHGRYNP